MKIVIFGGAGIAGSSLAKKLIKFDSIEEIIIADKNDKINFLKENLQSDKISYEVIDASQIESVRRVTSKVDLAVAAIPPGMNALNIVAACIEEGTHYMDFGLGTYLLYEILKYEDAFKNTGLCAFPCYGADPGISNIIAKHLSHKLDIVDEIKIRDGATVISKKGEFLFTYSPSIFFMECASKPVIYENKTFKRVQPLSHEEDFEFPPPVGKMKVYYVSHEEPFTLPRFIGKEVKFVDFKMAIPKDLYQTVKVLLKIGMLREDPIEINGVKVSPLAVLLSLIPKPVTSGNIEGFEMLVVQTKGEIKNEKYKLTGYVYLTHKNSLAKFGETATAFLTSICPAIVIDMFAKGEIKQTGVILPEMLDCEKILQRLRELGMPYEEKIEKI